MAGSDILFSYKMAGRISDGELCVSVICLGYALSTFGIVLPRSGEQLPGVHMPYQEHRERTGYSVALQFMTLAPSSTGGKTPHEESFTTPPPESVSLKGQVKNIARVTQYCTAKQRYQTANPASALSTEALETMSEPAESVWP